MTTKTQILCVRCKCEILRPTAPTLSTRKGAWSYCDICQRPPKAA